MSRSLNSGRKTTSNPKLKQPHNAKNCIGFQTFLKSRIDHSIINQSGTNIKKKVTRTEACEAQDQNNLELQLLADSELRLRHRNLKSRTEEQEKNALRLSSICENESTPRQNVLISSSQPIEPIYVCNRNSLQESGNTTYTLDSLEKKVQQLLQLKLMRKSQLKSFASFRMYEDQLQKDLQGLINQLQQYSTSTDQGNNCDIDYDIRQIAQKIGILERIIAESFTESQILKKYYFMKKMSRKSFQIFENKIRKSHGQEAAPAISRLVSSIPQHPSLHFSTISKSSYTKPNRDAYRKSQRSAKKILMSRQNICRSNYQSQFFNYGPLPVYPKMKQQTTTLSAMKMLDQKGSLYQSEFTEKKAEVIDSKSLDCRRDKFIPTKIMFMPKSLLNQKQNNEDRPKKIAKIKHKMIYEELSNSKPGNSSYSSFYKQPSLMMSSGWFGGTKKSTEYTSNFIGEKSIMECLAKQANLSNLKYEFKKNVRA